MIELVRVQAHQVGWIDVVDADDLKRFSFSDGLRGGIVAVSCCGASIFPAPS